MRVRVRLEQGETFEGEVGDLAPQSAFLKTERKFQFRDALTLFIGDLEIPGEVVHVSPVGVGVMLLASPELKAKIGSVARANAEAPRTAPTEASRPAQPVPPPPPAAAAEAPPAPKVQAIAELEAELAAYLSEGDPPAASTPLGSAGSLSELHMEPPVEADGAAAATGIGAGPAAAPSAEASIRASSFGGPGTGSMRGADPASRSSGFGGRGTGSMSGADPASRSPGFGGRGTGSMSAPPAGAAGSVGAYSATGAASEPMPRGAGFGGGGTGSMSVPPAASTGSVGAYSAAGAASEPMPRGAGFGGAGTGSMGASPAGGAGPYSAASPGSEPVARWAGTGSAGVPPVASAGRPLPSPAEAAAAMPPLGFGLGATSASGGAPAPSVLPPSAQSITGRGTPGPSVLPPGPAAPGPGPAAHHPPSGSAGPHSAAGYSPAPGGVGSGGTPSQGSLVPGAGGAPIPPLAGAPAGGSNPPQMPAPQRTPLHAPATRDEQLSPYAEALAALLLDEPSEITRAPVPALPVSPPAQQTAAADALAAFLLEEPPEAARPPPPLAPAPAGAGAARATPLPDPAPASDLAPPAARARLAEDAVPGEVFDDFSDLDASPESGVHLIGPGAPPDVWLPSEVPVSGAPGPSSGGGLLGHEGAPSVAPSPALAAARPPGGALVAPSPPAPLAAPPGPALDGPPPPRSISSGGLESLALDLALGPPARGPAGAASSPFLSGAPPVPVSPGGSAGLAGLTVASAIEDLAPPPVARPVGLDPDPRAPAAPGGAAPEASSFETSPATGSGDLAPPATNDVLLPMLWTVEGDVLVLETRLDALAAALTLLARRPLVARLVGGAEAGGPPPPRVRFAHDDLVLDLSAVLLAPGLAALAAGDRAAVERAVSLLSTGSPVASPSGAAPATPAGPPGGAPASPALDDFPALLDGRVVRFASAAQFATQFEANIGRGAVLVRSELPTLEGQRALELEIPPGERVSLTATACFRREGVVGFMIDDFSHHKPRLLQLAAAARGAAPLAPGAPARPSLGDGPTGRILRPRATPVPLVSPGARVRLISPTDAAAAFMFAAERPRSVDACGGWSVRILDLLARSGDGYVVTLRQGGRRLHVWIRSGRVCFTRLEPAEESDLLGYRLVADKKVSRRTLEQALERARSAGEPIGRTLVAMGAIPGPVMHAALRAQVSERALSIPAWDGGELEVGPWSDPPVGGELLTIQLSHLVASLLREHIRQLPAAAIERHLAGELDRALAIDTTRVEVSFLLNQKERRAIEIVASMRPTLRATPTAIGFSSASTGRLVLLCRAFGILEFTAPPPASPRDDLVLLASLCEELRTKTQGSPFDVLGLHWSASEADVIAAHKARLRELRERRRSRNVEIRDIVDRLVQLTESAHGLLTDPQKRREERLKAADEGERARVVALLLDRAERSLLAGDVPTARDHVSTAQEIQATERGLMLRNRLKL